MISNKKSYAMKMLQLALALSLLQVDPDNFLYQRLGSWDSQLELRDGDGWELEMLRAVPMVEYPYANRKTMMPLIDDLVCFDREHSNNQYNVTAYLLNVQSEGSDQTAAVQELQTAVATPASATITPGAMALEQAASAAAGIVNGNTSSLGLGSPDIDHFLNSEHFQDQISMWEQNLADLNDFGELPPSLNTYAGLPMKDEPSDVSYLDFNVDAYFPGYGTVPDGAVALNDSTPNPSDTSTIKVEEFDKDDYDDAKGRKALDEVASCSTLHMGCLKKEEPDDGDDSTNGQDVDISPFISDVELTQEESEIVEVLWKQDVDLGYTLSPPNLANGSLDAAGSSDVLKHSTNASDDVVEKLKALEELKHDKFDSKDDVLSDDDLTNEWAGIPFTIDNETGEYIRLPLEDLLNDVLQLAEFVDEEETIDDSIASTSKAAASKINNNNNSNNTLIESETEEGKDDNKNGDDTEDKLKDNYNKANTNSKTNNNNNEEDKISNDDDLPQSEIEVSSLPSPLFDLDDEANEELADLDIMIQSAAPPFHHHHHAHHAHAHRPSVGVQNYAVGGGANSAFHRQATGFHHSHHQSRVPLSRGVSMEQRLQDIASLFNPIPSMGVSDIAPYPHYSSHHYAYQSATAPPQHGQYPPPPPHPHHHGHHAMLHANATLGVDICPPSQPHYGHNLGSAVTSSMHLTNASHDGDVGAGATGGASNVGAYKMEHDMMYYSNASSDMNHTTDGFINSILNDEDLHLMDMNVNESFCRMVDVNNSTSNNSSVLGISSGHASGGAGSSSNGLSMSAATGGGGAGAAGGMTSELMNSGASSGDRLDASSDSAVSSMGSERVPSLSDGEWGEGSDSAQDYHHGKYGGPYDYSYSNNNRLNDGTRQPPVAQKKHQMFGKRFLQEQPGLGSAASANNVNGAIVDGSAAAAANNGLLQAPPPIKYEYEPYPTVIAGLPHAPANHHMTAESAMGPILSKEMQAYDLKYGAGAIGGGYSLDFSLRPPRTPHDLVQHNHTYTLPQGSGSLPRPQQRDKKISTSSSKSSKSSSNGDEEHLTRDEKRARALSIPIQVNDIINLPMDEFNERLSKYDLTENQLSLIRDIRRRGKNKVAAQNCRKRKLDQILSLEDEVKEVRRRKDQLCHDRDTLAVERKRISNKFAALHRHIFQYLRDPEGNPCSPAEYSLQQAADGSIYLLPRDSNKTDANTTTATATTRALNGISGSSNNNSVVGSSSSSNNMHLNLTQHHPHITHGNTQQQQQQQQHATHAHANHHQSQQQTHAHHTTHAATAHTTQQHPHHPHQKD